MNTDTITELCILGAALAVFIGVVICVTRRNNTDERQEQEERFIVS